MPEIKKVLFRCDASPEIGSGHVMRCLTLAHYFANTGWICEFISSEVTLKTVPALQKSNYIVHTPNTPIDHTDLLVVDHYGLDIDYEHNARTWADRIAVIDDLADRAHDCDLLIDQTLGRKEEEYQNLTPESCRILTGSRYAILRSQFLDSRSLVPDRRSQTPAIKTILIFPGSTNVHNITGKILNAFENYKKTPFILDVVLSSTAQNLSDIRNTIESMNESNIHTLNLHLDVEDMASMMMRADLAIGAGGTTSWERCCLGLPTLTIELADNQKDVLQSLENYGAIINLGSHKEITSNKIIDSIEYLQNTPEKMHTLSFNAISVCDGSGGEKLISEIEKLYTDQQQSVQNFQLTTASMDDADILLKWRNDPETRMASVNTAEIKLEEHISWLKRVLDDSDKYLFIALQNNEKVGTVRADLSDDSYELSWTVAPEHRGKGIAKKMVFSIINKLKSPVYAKIKTTNPASQRIAESAGMVLEKECGEILHYSRN